MSYPEALDYLYAQLPMFQRIGPAAYKKDLGNTLALCARLGNPHTRFKSVHVGGTNGKGSVSHMLAAVFQAAGLKTGLYISPHYKDFRERIKINGRYIPRRRVVSFVEDHRTAIEAIQPSFFELCVAMAFDHFAREKVDIAVVEVGLGGRLDSTNVITPLLSVITNISFDHMNLLGDTLPLIAFEKAGIIKPGIPVVIGETHPDTAPVFQKKAAETGSDIAFADRHFQVAEMANDRYDEAVYDVWKDGQPYLPALELDAAGPFQARNVATVLQACERLNLVGEPFSGPRRITPERIRRGLRELATTTKFIGRWQWISRQPAVLCDSAHNEAGLHTILNRIRSLPFRRIHFVLGFVNDKPIEPVLALFPKEACYYFAKANIPRGMEAAQVAAKAAAGGFHGKAYVSVKNALKAACRAAHPDDLIVVTGSIFVVAEVL